MGEDGVVASDVPPRYLSRPWMVNKIYKKCIKRDGLLERERTLST